jgi:phosphoribosyl-AMP cyclohydrolase
MKDWGNCKNEVRAANCGTIRIFNSKSEGASMTIDFDKSGGLVPAIAQDAETGQVLMLAWMNREAYDETLRTGRAVYFSRSRQKLWRKGEESGHVQEVREVFLDCDADTILLKVHQIGGAACHEGYASCFFRKVEPNGLRVVGERVFDPKQVYRK